LEHFYSGIPGWCDYADYYAQVVAALPSGSTLVEVGAWQGQSTACLGVEIANSGKDWSVTAFVKNLTNEDSITWLEVNSNLVGSFRSAFLLDPRVYGVNLRVGF
jgi:hypothetical protein